MRQRVPATVSDGFPVDRPRVRRAARWVAALCIVASSAGCILTQDIPVPALEIPQAYKAAKSTGLDAPPPLDWWRGFGSPELTTLMEEAQSVNLDIAAAVARFREADAQARIAGAPLLPTLAASGPGNLFQESYSRVSGS
ncbi:MAG: RND transporter, partial [Bradyrhizobium sp.]